MRGGTPLHPPPAAAAAAAAAAAFSPTFWKADTAAALDREGPKAGVRLSRFAAFAAMLFPVLFFFCLIRFFNYKK